ncbi:MAG: hypothetical protein CMP67_00750 [Flavobacteriales bacterium]|nr:hypothetical protein [Flavobacteriales bacterium]|tara:strand:+ start:4280 stop:6031 length:1752 start_codon:yes stop_codon:yes gene_type:complete
MNRLTYFILFSSHLIFGQIHINWPEKSFVNFKHEPDSVYDSWSDFNNDLLNIQKESYSKGLLEFSLDSLTTFDSIFFIPHITFGKPYSWKTINLIHKGIDIPKSVLSNWENKLVTPENIILRIDDVVDFFQRNGYPFVSVNLDSISLEQEKISGYLDVKPGPKITWDTLSIFGQINLNNYYLENYLGIKVGKPYDERVLKEAYNKLKELPFVTIIEQPKVAFFGNKASMQLNLKKKSANFINGIIGILPNTSSVLTGDESQLVITGDLKLHLGNSFGYGEKIKMNWKRMQTESQQLNTEEEIPFILQSFVGIYHSLNLLKQDTSFINYKNRVGIKYDFSAKQSFTGFWENETTNQLSTENLSKSNLTSINGNQNTYGLNLLINWLDYKYNPRKGFYLMLETKSGLKKIIGNKENNKIVIPISETNEIESSLFVPEKSMVYQGEIQIEGYLPIWRLISLKLANNSGFKFNDYLLDNDLFRLGGFRLLRGFDQQSIFATNYSIFTTELKILFEENSFLNLFFDQSFIEKSTITEKKTNQTSAFGAGINFQAKPGIFSISYALGRFEDTRFNFSSAKIHFGFINLF